MALDLFKFLRGNSKRKEKKNYDPSNPLSSTKFLGGMKNTSVKTKPEPKMFPIPTDRKRPDYAIALDVATGKEYEDYALDVGRNAATPIPSDAEIVGRGRSATRRIGTPDTEMGYEGAPKPLGGLRKPEMDLKRFGTYVQDMKSPESNIKVFRNRLQRIRNKRKSAAQAQYDKQMEARNKRVTAMRAKGGQFRPTNLKPEDLKTLRQAVRDQEFTEPLGRNTALGKAHYLTTSGKRQLAMRQRNIARKEAKDKEENK